MPYADPAKRRAFKRTYYLKNRERKRQIQRRADLRRKYGLSMEDYAAMLASQSWACAVCHKPFTVTALVDHCHTLGHVRGLLCNACNVALGRFEDDPERMRRAARYIETKRNPQCV